jgi:AcrR family transcriptional regulator
MTRGATAERRTQEERSAATRERLLDATIECLIELGYGGTTTTEIVRRAGVSRGAQVHHFPTKAELVQNAIAHLAHKRHQELRKGFARLDSNGDRVSNAIDLLWSAYTGPLFAAGLELIVAARTDPSLRPALERLQSDIASGIESLCRDNFGEEVIRRPAFRDAIELTTSVMGGRALFGLLDPPRRNDARFIEVWKRIARPLFEEALSNRKGKR